MKDTPLELNMLQQGPFAWLLRLGIFESFTIMALLTVWGKKIWEAQQCRCPLPPTYFHTGDMLIGIFSAYFCLSTLQGIFQALYDRPSDSRVRWLKSVWMLLVPFFRGIPFVFFLLSLVALPEYRSNYQNSGLILLFVRLILEAAFISRKISLLQPKNSIGRLMEWRFRRGPVITSLVLGAFLAHLALPNFCVPRCATPIGLTRSNMYNYQTILETYAVDWGGVYPPSLEVLEQEATLPSRMYWKELANPCTRAEGRKATIMMASDASLLVSVERLGFRFDLKAGNSRCMVLYHRRSLTEYRIFGTGPNGQLIRERSGPLVLSNS